MIANDLLVSVGHRTCTLFNSPVASLEFSALFLQEEVGRPFTREQLAHTLCSRDPRRAQVGIREQSPPDRAPRAEKITELYSSRSTLLDSCWGNSASTGVSFSVTLLSQVLVEMMVGLMRAGTDGQMTEVVPAQIFEQLR